LFISPYPDALIRPVIFTIVIGIIGFLLSRLLDNITERKRAEEALRKEKERAEQYLGIAGVMLVTVNTDENITLMNSKGCEILGYKEGELIGKNWFDILVPKRVRDEIRSVFRRLMDITERKQAEQAVQEKNEQLDTQNEELQSQRQELMGKTRELEMASRAKSDFLSSMSHELRTPLNAVIGFSELMIDGIPGEINDEQKQCLGDIWNSGQHLLNLINDVLDLSKVEAGKMELRLRDLNLADAINDAAQTVKLMLDKNRHQLAVNIEEGLPQVRADKSRLRQMVLNLLSNAINATPPGGEIAIDVSREGDWCQVSVVDNGIGIKKDDQENIFEAFTQVETLPDRRKEGTGLGLTLTKQFVEAIGGRIWLESEYGKGSKFTFTLPLAKEGKPYLEREGDK